jgi:hypothetical protein
MAFNFSKFHDITENFYLGDFMTTISLFTPITYERPRSCEEGALSTLSNYFHLSGPRATVVKRNEARLENEKVSWSSIALKVASYVLLFPLTLTLLAIHLVLRSQHHFTVIISGKKSSPEPEKSQESKSAPQHQSLVPVKPERGFSIISPTVTVAEHTQAVILPSNQEPLHLSPVLVTV